MKKMVNYEISRIEIFLLQSEKKILIQSI